MAIAICPSAIATAAPLTVVPAISGRSSLIHSRRRSSRAR